MNNALILIPVFNEELNVGKVLDECTKHFENILVVDDGSTDETIREIKKFNQIKLLKHCINCGQGTSIATGIQYFLGQTSFEYLITLDGDGQHLISDAINMLKHANTYSYDVIFASRFYDKESESYVPKKRRLLLKMARAFEKFFYKINLTDSHNGLRVLNRKAGKMLINLNSAGMAHASEIAMRLVQSEIRYTELPCKILYNSNNKQSQSGLNSLNIISDLLQRK